MAGTRKNRTDDKTPPEPSNTENDINKAERTSTKPPPPPFIKLFQLQGPETPEEEIKKIVHEQVEYDLVKFGISENYNILFLHDTSTMVRSDSDRIYKAVTSFKQHKPVLLILNSGGGEISAAYLIAKLCREYSDGRFVVAVPRRAKSAATLICCGADEIHMGSLSELGPIDPQIDGVPALALKNSIQHLAELVRIHPAASEMFASFLSKSLNLKDLGYYERVAVSAAHYATILLRARNATGTKPHAEVAGRLVYGYNDHGFVIDSNESIEIFGSEFIKMNTQEYQLANGVYQSLNFIESVCKDIFHRYFYFTGTALDGCVINPMPQRNR